MIIVMLGKKSMLFCLLFFLSVLLSACSPSTTSRAASAVGESTETHVGVDDAGVFAERFGIKVVALRETAAGHMLDFRFQVVDVHKALPFFREDIKPYLLQQATGKALAVPVSAKLGPMRPTGRNPKPGVTYWIFFGNPGLVKAGDLVTIVIGDYQMKDLRVEGQ